MSDEQNPPPPVLRLKPRLRPADGRPQPDAAVGTGAEAPVLPSVTPPESPSARTESGADEAGMPKIRFRPKLNVAPAEAGPVSAAASSSESPAIPEVFPPQPPSPPVFAQPSSAQVMPPLFISDLPAGADAAAPVLFSDVPSVAGAETGKFRLKPKAPIGAAGSSGEVPAVVSPLDAPATEAAAAPMNPSSAASAPPDSRTKSPPPFPVVALGSAGKPPPVPVPHMAVKGDVLEPEMPVSTPTPPSKSSAPRVIGGLVALAVLGGAGFFAWQHFMVTPPAPPPATKAAPAKSAPAATAPKTSVTAVASEAMNTIAHAPANAIHKAQDAIAARRASGQTRVDTAALGESPPDQPQAVAAAPTKTPPPPANIATAQTTVAPGLSATIQIEAAPEASPALRALVINMKVSGVFQGTPARAFINGKLTRTGETVDAALGVTFEGIDHERRQLIFKDKSGATVLRKF